MSGTKSKIKDTEASQFVSVKKEGLLCLNFTRLLMMVPVVLMLRKKGCWINAIAPTEEERNFLIEHIGVLPEFVKSSLDDEESSHIDYDDDFDQTLVIIDYPDSDESDVNKNEDYTTLQYKTNPMGIVILKGYVVTISLYESWSLQDMAQGRIRQMDTRLKTRFLLCWYCAFRNNIWCICVRSIVCPAVPNRSCISRWKIKN